MKWLLIGGYVFVSVCAILLCLYFWDKIGEVNYSGLKPRASRESKDD